MCAQSSGSILNTGSVAGTLADHQPVRRAGVVDDIARAAVFLASDEATFSPDFRLRGNDGQ